ncbi:tail fiber protein [Lysinibacillus sp. KU-BSD001]|uniref:phage tail protein n=1 Tax=Lysinibacillus sp. KU-BSD001 TaxID=3141328 RepID=UPI0036EFC149
MEPILGEIRLFSFGFTPSGWAVCNGQLLMINQNQALFSILGTTYGGNGVTTFALPDLRGRVPVHVGNGIRLGQMGGEESHVLTVNEMPAHTHHVMGSSQNATLAEAAESVWGTTSDPKFYTANQPNIPMSIQALSPTGSSQAHANMQPYNVANYCIAIQGMYPSRN